MNSFGNIDKYTNLFHENMSNSDMLLHAVLTGHLITEIALDNILALIFFHPEHVFQDAKLSFVQKVHVIRAYGLRKNTNSMWSMILALNTVRNELAHNLEGEKKEARLKNLRMLFISEATDEMRGKLEQTGKSLEEMPDQEIAMYSSSLCTGFLSAFEEDIEALRGILTALDEDINSDRERVQPKTAAEAKAKQRKGDRPRRAAE